MRAAGNIPVDRKNKNNQSLFKGSFEGASDDGCSYSSPLD